MVSVDIGFDFARGAIAGAMVISAAYLAGFAVFRQGAAAVCGLLLVAAAGALQVGWLGLTPTPSPKIMALLQGLFGAAAILYLSATIRAARDNALLGGLLFAAALIMVGSGVISFVLSKNAIGLTRAALLAVGVFSAMLAISQWRRDVNARLLLPGVLIALAAPLSTAALGGGDASVLSFNALFALGVVAASLVSLTEAASSRPGDINLHAGAQIGAVAADEPDPERMMRVSENQLARVLDYAGVAVWDWSPEEAHQTEGLAKFLGTNSHAVLSPDAMQPLLDDDGRRRFDSEVLARGKGDGSFDTTLRLVDGRRVRFRGARAVDTAGEVERLVAFVENLSPSASRAKGAAPAVGLAADLETSADRKDPLISEISEALAKDQLSTAFQPIVSLSDGSIVGYEALIRWPGDNGGPEKAGAEASVRAAEAAGKDGELARFVLKAAAAHLSSQMKTLDRRDLFIAMNLSVPQLRDAELAADLRAAMEQYNLPLKSVVLEITETQAITDVAAAGDKFRAFKQAGAALAFDDFGAGFSSLSNLKQFEFDYLKIDKSFVDGLTQGGDAEKIGRAIAQLGRELGLTVIAEGVENSKTAEAAKAAGCALAQGYQFGAPEEATDRASTLSAEKPDPDGGKSRRMFWRGGLR